MIPQEATSNISRLTELLAAHGVYALTIIFIFYQQWRAGKNLKAANPDDHAYFRKIHTSVVITTYTLVIISTAVWIYATFIYSPKLYIKGSISGLTEQVLSPQKPTDPPKVVEVISPESMDIELYQSKKNKDISSTDGKYDLGWVLLPRDNIQTLVFVLQHHYEIARMQKPSLTPGSRTDSIESRAIEKRFTLDLRKIPYSPGASIQLMYQADPVDRVQKIGAVYLRNPYTGNLAAIPWEEIASDRKTTRNSVPSSFSFFSAVYAGSVRVFVKENGDYDQQIGRILKEQMRSPDLKIQLMARNELIENGKRSFKFIGDALKSSGSGDNSALLVANLGAAVLGIESAGNPAPPEIDIALAKAFYDIGDNESSALFFTKAGDKPFKDPEFYYYRGWAYFQTKQYDKALRSLKDFIHREERPYSRAVAYNVAGSTYMLLSNDKEAIEYYKKAIDLYPKLSNSYNNLAYLYAERGYSLDKALSLVDKAAALETDPARLASYKDTKGWILYKMGKYNQAVAMLKEAAAQLPDASDVHQHLQAAQARIASSQR